MPVPRVKMLTIYSVGGDLYLQMTKISYTCALIKNPYIG